MLESGFRHAVYDIYTNTEQIARVLRQVDAPRCTRHGVADWTRQTSCSEALLMDNTWEDEVILYASHTAQNASSTRRNIKKAEREVTPSKYRDP